MSKGSKKVVLRTRRRVRVRKKVSGNAARPRLSVFRSNRYIYAQIIDDVAGHTLAAASSRESGVTEDGSSGSAAAAARVGQLLAERAKEKAIETVVFDRGGYRYHGRVAALADAAREGGLTF